MLNRSSDRSAAAFKKINEYIADVKSDSKCYQIACDLQDFASVRAAATQVKEQFPAGIDVLCNNAGIAGQLDVATKDGYGMTISDAHPLCVHVLAGTCLNKKLGMYPTVALHTSDVIMQTNHLSHFLLTKELFPLLNLKAEAVGEARIVNHSSIAAWMDDLPLDAKYLGKNGGSLH